MRLTDLEPEFIKCDGTVAAGILDADGVTFTCPKCGEHRIICWQPHVPPEVLPGPGRWRFRGSGVKNLTLRMGTSSVLLHGGCGAHFSIERGEVRLL